MCSIQQYLNNKDRFFIVQVAEKIGYSSGKITFMLSDDMSNFRKYENELRIRICDEINCKNVFDEGFLTEESNVFYSEKCCYSSIENLKDDDFGDTILHTNWYEETLISR